MDFQKIRGHKNQLRYLDHLKKSGDIPHALLFSGQKGIGKRLIAETFAASLFCTEKDSPCGKCHSCLQMKAGAYPDFFVLEVDEKGKIPVGSSDRSQPGTVRWMIDRLTRSSVNGKYIVIVDGIESISEAGQNALLKTIEEPGPDTHIILIAESKSGILPTIVSRCIEIGFNPLTISEINDIIAEELPERQNSQVVSSICGGSAGTAIRLYDEKVFDGIVELCREIKTGFGGAEKEVSPPGFSSGFGDGGFTLSVLINLYSCMLREHIADNGFSLPADILLSAEEAEKAVKILLAIKKGLKNNLNVKNILKGMLYSISDMKSRGFPEPDFSWL
ncbi:MAG TPA: DNA polymerase III subunit [Spirochaetota bacterium]|nr:DNA polymerase III subunit [Spirochaetota bacterium]